MWHDQRILVPGKAVGWFVVVDSGWKHDKHLILVPGKTVGCFVVVDSGWKHDQQQICIGACTVNRTFHRANPSTLKHFIRQFFSFPIVSYGVWDGESYKKIEYLFIFDPYLSVLMVRE